MILYLYDTYVCILSPSVLYASGLSGVLLTGLLCCGTSTSPALLCVVWAVVRPTMSFQAAAVLFADVWAQCLAQSQTALQALWRTCSAQLVYLLRCYLRKGVPQSLWQLQPQDDATHWNVFRDQPWVHPREALRWYLGVSTPDCNGTAPWAIIGAA